MIDWSDDAVAAFWEDYRHNYDTKRAMNAAVKVQFKKHMDIATVYAFESGVDHGMHEAAKIALSFEDRSVHPRDVYDAILEQMMDRL